MFLYALAALSLLIGLGFLCRWVYCRKKMRTAPVESQKELTVEVEGEADAVQNKDYEKKAKTALVVTVVCMVLTEVFILIANQVAL